MARKGRKPLAAGHVEHLSGSELAKLRLSLILKTMLGQLTVAQACTELGVCESRFHALRNKWLQEAVELLEPRRMGRPAKNVESDERREIDQLEAALKEMQREAEVAEVRQAIADILRPPSTEPKKNASARQQRRQRHQRHRRRAR